MDVGEQPGALKSIVMKQSREQPRVLGYGVYTSQRAASTWNPTSVGWLFCLLSV
jgi:hypothetical protein